MKADLNQSDKDGDTPAMMSAHKGDAQSLKLLAEMKADLNQANKDGDTPAHYSAAKGHVQSPHLLAEI